MATLSVEDWALRPLTLDAADMVVPDFLIANGGDMYGRGIDLQVTQDGQNASMTGMTVYLFWRHEDGTQDMTKFTAVSANTGHFRCYYPPGMLAHGGEVLARISIYIGSQKQTGSRNFRIIVEPNPIDSDEAMADESFSEFLQAVEDLNQLEDSVRAAEQARVTAENSRASAETTRRNNETARQKSEEDREEAEDARASAEQTRQSNETIRQGNEQTRINHENTRVSNESGRVTAESSRESAEEDRAEEYANLRSNVQASISAANAAAQSALAAAASAGNMVRDSLLTEDTAASIDRLAKESCTSGMFIAGTWYVHASDVSLSGEVLTVHGSGMTTGNRMLLPTSRCAAHEALLAASEALSLAQGLMGQVEEMAASVEDMRQAVSALALNAGSYPFRIGATLYVRGVSYASGRLTVPTASYSGGRMLISDM